MPAPSQRLPGGTVLLLTLACLFALPAMAQGVYRIVGPDGRVSYSDQPPPAANPARPATGATAGGAPAGSAALPFALRQPSARFPVTLYTSSDCSPCRTATSYLERRGIPFTEKTVESNADLEALQRLSGGHSLPVLTVGRQQMRGFNEAEWKQYLDAAGYPEQSVLPSNYRRPAATPLVAASQAPSAPAGSRPAQEMTPASPEPAPIPVTPPPGIRF
ncbi:MAG TPA: glutaredoxin family protein [Paracoccaceae bacterium]|uniref:glutaredoxin family protein n=1 Tax=Hydrogenophaga sp. TaxID=1904254 RepID=UPI002C7DBFC9|nr:glutaredoxin family protein [Hydrogenophaga sp.]HMO06071.1 glutaredoxin family protein [Paracoccaceae bacterium]HMP11220.1 glutaredoxin family protein [Hydrogenophaga sp.]